MTEIIHYAVKDTSLGLIAMAASVKGICFVEFGEDEPDLMARLKAEFPKVTMEPSTTTRRPELSTWINALASYLDNGAGLPDLPLDIRGTEFDNLVWQALMTIPEGDVMGYSKLASHLGRPEAVRAVASACGRNRIAVLIPCHRVLRGDGQLGGYRWGLFRKQALLQAEQARVFGGDFVKAVV